MNNNNKAALSLLTLFLTACGGGDNEPVVAGDIHTNINESTPPIASSITSHHCLRDS